MNLKRTPEKEIAFCAALAATGSVTRACEAVGIGRSAAYEWRHESPEFAKMWAHAKELGVEAMEDEALRRAVEGNDEPVFHQGVATGTIRKYSDTLLIFLLKGAKPEKYRERTETNLNVKGELDIATRLAEGRKRVGSL